MRKKVEVTKSNSKWTLIAIVSLQEGKKIRIVFYFSSACFSLSPRRRATSAGPRHEDRVEMFAVKLDPIKKNGEVDDPQDIVPI